MNKVMMSLAGVVAMAAAAVAEGNTPPEVRLQRNEIAVAGPESAPTVRPVEGVRPARKRFSSAAIARIYDSTWKVAAPPLEGAPATSARTKAIYDKSFGPRLTPMDAVAALPTVPPVIPVFAPVMPDMPAIAEDLESLEDAFADLPVDEEVFEEAAPVPPPVYADETGTMSGLGDSPAADTKGNK